METSQENQAQIMVQLYINRPIPNTRHLQTLDLEDVSTEEKQLNDHQNRIKNPNTRGIPSNTPLFNIPEELRNEMEEVRL